MHMTQTSVCRHIRANAIHAPNQLQASSCVAHWRGSAIFTHCSFSTLQRMTQILFVFSHRMCKRLPMTRLVRRQPARSSLPPHWRAFNSWSIQSISPGCILSLQGRLSTDATDHRISVTWQVWTGRSISHVLTQQYSKLQFRGTRWSFFTTPFRMFRLLLFRASQSFVKPLFIYSLRRCPSSGQERPTALISCGANCIETILKNFARIRSKF